MSSWAKAAGFAGRDAATAPNTGRTPELTAAPSGLDVKRSQRGQPGRQARGVGRVPVPDQLPGPLEVALPVRYIGVGEPGRGLP